MVTTTYTVTGMTCAHCASSVREEIEELPVVSAVAVDLSNGAVTVTSESELSGDKVREAVEQAGYRLARVE